MQLSCWRVALLRLVWSRWQRSGGSSGSGVSLEEQATTPPFRAGMRLRPVVGPPPSAKLLVKFRVAGRPCPGRPAAVPSATLAPGDDDRPRPRAGRPRGPPPPGPGR